MDYVLGWDGDSAILAVELTYAASQKDSTVFIFGDPGFGGQNDIFKVIRNIRVTRPEVVRIDEADRRITIYHNGAKNHRITYEIEGSLPVDKPTTISLTELFRPVISKGILTLVNMQFDLAITDQSNPLVSFSWRRYPENLTYFNSVEPSQTDPSKKLIDYYDNLSQKVYFVMGDNIGVQEYDVLGIPYYAVTTKEDNYGNDLQERLSPFFESYFQSIHRFWNDTEFPFYYLAVTALQNNQKEIGGGGFGMRNGFVMKLGRKFGTRDKYVTAHETSHTWIGIKIIIGENSFDHQWFGEGFNDYATIINLANSKIYGEEDFLHYFNEENFKKHYESAIKDVHNDSIATNYWTDYANYGVLPYRRGCIYAFYLDNQIRLASDGKFTLRNMLLDLYELRKAKKKDEVLTVDDFINAGAAYLDKKELEEQIARYMIAGQPIDFEGVKTIPEFNVEVHNNIPKLSLAAHADLSKIYRW
ncbi:MULTISPECIES: gluzincin family metallopeptidase [Sinomicrobium]|uniref:Peptidase M1 membrane alanine aminopeptidase domain-containing protein n=1 Tax=Sinomicrobium oceani TaxID=1150368 RepID=A0A1K1Q6J3_9FLAO|nr:MULTISPECIES: hypothetical protein [Sinomicrobium]RAV29008.1 hypothetical protein DN748_11525 [Sinomicrobium sp. N-1-3-6]SFW55479.1 hypothetical protein SAMN02927921_02319 [Sinomicrobium oceani]